MRSIHNKPSRGLIRDQEMADILLVQSGFKPVAMVEISCPVRSSVLKRKRFRERVREFEDELRMAGLQYKLHVNYPKHAQVVTRFSYIARDKRTLAKLIAADHKKDVHVRRIALGILLGYPESAVRAFARNESPDIKDIPKHIKRGRAWKFLNFRLSKLWRQEMKYVRRRARAIRQASPDLYKRIIGAKQKRTV